MLMDYDALLRQHPKQPGETEQAWRTRLTSDGLARFTTKAVMRNLVNYRDVLASAAAAKCPVVIVPDADPQFVDRSYGATLSMEDLAANMVRQDAGKQEPRTITRQQAQDVRFLQQQRDLAKQEGRELVIVGGEPTPGPVEYENVINVSREVRDDPRRYAEVRRQAVAEGKQLRFLSGAF